MKKICIMLLVTMILFTGCGSDTAVSSVSQKNANELSTAEQIDVVAALTGTVRNFEPDLEIPEGLRDYTIGMVDGHYNLVCTAKRPDGSNAIVSYFVDLDGDDYSVHYFSVKDDVYVDDGTIE